jgi:hypothetical protein
MNGVTTQPPAAIGLEVLVVEVGARLRVEVAAGQIWWYPQSSGRRRKRRSTHVTTGLFCKHRIILGFCLG